MAVARRRGDVDRVARAGDSLLRTKVGLIVAFGVGNGEGGYDIAADCRCAARFAADCSNSAGVSSRTTVLR